MNLLPFQSGLKSICANQGCAYPLINPPDSITPIKLNLVKVFFLINVIYVLQINQGKISSVLIKLPSIMYATNDTL